MKTLRPILVTFGIPRDPYYEHRLDSPVDGAPPLSGIKWQPPNDPFLVNKPT